MVFAIRWHAKKWKQLQAGLGQELRTSQSPLLTVLQIQLLATAMLAVRWHKTTAKQQLLRPVGATSAKQADLQSMNKLTLKNNAGMQH